MTEFIAVKDNFEGCKKKKRKKNKKKRKKDQKSGLSLDYF